MITYQHIDISKTIRLKQSTMFISDISTENSSNYIQSLSALLSDNKLCILYYIPHYRVHPSNNTIFTRPDVALLGGNYSYMT